jgi:hypothetical protein
MVAPAVTIALAGVYALQMAVFAGIGSYQRHLGGYSVHTDSPFYTTVWSLANYTYGPTTTTVGNTTTVTGSYFDMTPVAATGTNNYTVDVSLRIFLLLLLAAVVYASCALLTRSAGSSLKAFKGGEYGALHGPSTSLALLVLQVLGWSYIQSDLVFLLGEKSAEVSILAPVAVAAYALGLFFVDTEKAFSVEKAADAKSSYALKLYVYFIVIVGTGYFFSSLIASLYRPYTIRAFVGVGGNALPQRLETVLAVHTVNIVADFVVFGINMYMNATGMSAKKDGAWSMHDTLAFASHAFLLLNVSVYAWCFTTMFAKVGNLGA